MNIKCFFIVCVVCFQLVEMKSECGEHFKCFGDFLNKFIGTDLKYDFIIKEKKQSGDNLDTSVITIQIPSYKLINILEQVINLFDHEGYFEIKHKIEKGITIVNAEDLTPLKKQMTSVVGEEYNKFEGERIGEITNNTFQVKTEDEDVKSNEVRIDEFDDYYDLENDNTTDYPIIDYIDLYKDTTNELTPVFVTEVPMIEKLYKTTVHIESVEDERVNMQKQCNFNGTSNDVARSVFPWIVALFVKNGLSDQFDYYCDGVLLTDRDILTAAHCVNRKNMVIDADDIIVLLGKRSLQTMGDKEKAVKIAEISLHDNFTTVFEEGNDLAILRIREPVSFDDAVQPSCLATSEDTDEFIQDGVEIFTTGWAVSGELTPIRLDKEKSKLCQKDVRSDDTFCANYNNDVTTCPSYGGLFVAKGADEVWRVRGVRTGDPSQKGFCMNTGVFYTDLLRHSNWIQNNV